MSAGATLEAEGIARDGARRGLAEVSVRLEPGALAVARGAEPECSTLVKALSRTLEPDRGRLLLEAGDDVLELTHADPRAVAWARRRWLGIFDGALRALPNRTALRVVAGAGDSGAGEAEVLAGLGLAALDEPVGLLEERERTVVALAAALVRPAPILLLHRPLAGLDGEARERALALIDRARAAGSAVLATASRGDDLAADADIEVEIRGPA
jgi:alpha-D-ribose 1-methylphosphonate 5-triphosphate synthase subunit PhnL